MCPYADSGGGLPPFTAGGSPPERETSGGSAAGAAATTAGAGAGLAATGATGGAATGRAPEGWPWERPPDRRSDHDHRHRSRSRSRSGRGRPGRHRCRRRSGSGDGGHRTCRTAARPPARRGPSSTSALVRTVRWPGASSCRSGWPGLSTVTVGAMPALRVRSLHVAALVVGGQGDDGAVVAGAGGAARSGAGRPCARPAGRRGSTRVTSSTWMPRAAMSVATSTVARPSEKAARLRVAGVLGEVAVQLDRGHAVRR